MSRPQVEADWTRAPGDVRPSLISSVIGILEENTDENLDLEGVIRRARVLFTVTWFPLRQERF